jgi:hypothetical protein
MSGTNQSKVPHAEAMINKKTPKKVAAVLNAATARR